MANRFSQVHGGYDYARNDAPADHSLALEGGAAWQARGDAEGRPLQRLEVGLVEP